MLGTIKGLDIIQYFPPKSSYFLIVPLEDCRGNTVGLDGAEERSMKQEGRRQRRTFEIIAQEHKVNQLQSTGSKKTSQIQVNLNPQAINHRHAQRWQDSSKALSKREEWVAPRGWDDRPTH